MICAALGMSLTDLCIQRFYNVKAAMWGALMTDHEPPGRRRLSLHGRTRGVSDSEVRRSDARTTEH